MDEIATAANLNRGTIYLHFSDKAAILRAALARSEGDELAIYQSGVEVTSREDVTIMFERALDIWNGEFGSVWRHAHEAATTDPEIQRWLDDFFEGQVAKTRELIESRDVDAQPAQWRALMLVSMWDAFVYRLADDTSLANTHSISALADLFEAACAPQAL